MDEGGQQAEEVRAQAAQWVSRLNSLPVSRETLDAFFAWRKIEGRRAAYDEAAGVWNAAGNLASHPDMRALAEEAYAKGERRRRTSRLDGKIMAAAAALVVVASGADMYLRWTSGDVYTTKVGEQSVVTLADGSKLALDTDTKLVVRYSDASRKIDLEKGQAYFTVAHNAARPFIVDADGTDVVATGTQFGVRRRNAGVDVTLVEGKVRVTPPHADATDMVSGQQLVLRPDRPPVLRQVDAGAATSWRRGRIVLDGMTLRDAVAEVNRYTATPIVLDADRLAGETFGGSFEAGDVDSFVAAASALLSLKVSRDEDNRIHLIDPDQKSSG